MSQKETLRAFELHLITEEEAIEQAGVDSLDELVECVHPEWVIPSAGSAGVDASW